MTVKRTHHIRIYLSETHLSWEDTVKMLLMWMENIWVQGALLFLLFPLLIYKLSQELKSVNCFLRAKSSLDPHTKALILQVGSRAQRSPWHYLYQVKRTSSCYFEEEKKKKTHSRKVQPCKASAREGKNTFSIIMLGSCLSKDSFIAKSFKWGKVRMKERDLPSAFFKATLPVV